MRVPSKTEQEAIPPEVSMEVQIWLDKGWTIMPTKRRGLVLSGKKKVRPLGKIGLGLGVIFLAGFFAHHPLIGTVGILLLVGTWLDFKFNTKPPTKFFPEPGEKTRVMDRG